MATECSPEFFDFFLVPKFSLLTFASASEPLRIANWLSGRQLYSWRFISIDGLPCPASNGILLPVDGSIRDVTRSSNLIVCAATDAHAYNDRRVFGWLRRLYRSGTRIVSIGAGTYLLARAGILDGESCTLHWEEHATFHELYPRTKLSSAIYASSGRVFTSAGGTAAMDTLLHIIGERHGRDFIGAIAEQFINDDVRSGEAPQRMHPQIRTGATDRRILRAIAIMESNIETPVTIPKICRASCVSIRHIQRTFQRLFNCTPQNYYLRLRLRFARQRLLHSQDAIVSVALSAGFGSPTHFSRKYREFFGHPPKLERAGTRSGLMPRPAALASV